MSVAPVSRDVLSHPTGAVGKAVDVTLEQQLSTRRDDIVQQWLGVYLASYPAESAGFFQTEKDAFRNPVGVSVRRHLEALVDFFARSDDGPLPDEAIDSLMRLRAVQEVPPARALAFLTDVRPILRAVVAGTGAAEHRDALDGRVDRLVLAAFERYVAARERIYALRAREAQSRVHSLLRRAGLVVEMEDEPRNTENHGRE